MKITCLMENTTHMNGITAEHGLSLYIETQSHNILFDMGQSDAFIKNADLLNVDLRDVDIAVLSHGHYDHGGGLLSFMQLNDKAVVYLNKYSFEEHYNGTEKYIGLNKELLKFEDRFIYTDEDTKIDDGLFVYECKNYKPFYKIEPFGLNVLYDGEFVPENFKHEHCLEIIENNKKVLISGCSHNGILNIMKWFRPDVLVGGFHFMKINPSTESDKLMKYANKLSEYNAKYYTCHCTGVEQYEFLKEHFSGDLNYVSAGDKIIL